MKQTFKKEERLTSKILISKLFEEGKKWNSYPFRIITLDHPVPLCLSCPAFDQCPQKPGKEGSAQEQD